MCGDFHSRFVMKAYSLDLERAIFFFVEIPIIADLVSKAKILRSNKLLREKGIHIYARIVKPELFAHIKNVLLYWPSELGFLM